MWYFAKRWEGCLLNEAFSRSFEQKLCAEGVCLAPSKPAASREEVAEIRLIAKRNNACLLSADCCGPLSSLCHSGNANKHIEEEPQDGDWIIESAYAILSLSLSLSLSFLTHSLSLLIIEILLLMLKAMWAMSAGCGCSLGCANARHMQNA